MPRTIHFQVRSHVRFQGAYPPTKKISPNLSRNIPSKWTAEAIYIAWLMACVKLPQVAPPFWGDDPGDVFWRKFGGTTWYGNRWSSQAVSRFPCSERIWESNLYIYISYILGSMNGNKKNNLGTKQTNTKSEVPKRLPKQQNCHKWPKAKSQIT